MSEAYISQSLDKIRLKLLDLTKRNRLLNFRRNKSTVFIVDEQPKQVFQKIANDGNPMTFAGVPEPTLGDLKEVGIEGDSASLRRNKDALRMLVANRKGINLNEELPMPIGGEEALKKHSDNFLQTGLFMPELETRLRRIRSDARSYIEETGQNRLFLAFGFLQWTEREDLTTRYQAPLILLPVELSKGKIDSKTRCYRYSVNYTGEDLIHNLSLAEKLKRDFDLILPTFDDPDVVNRFNGDEELDPEKYFSALQKAITPFSNWGVSRKVVLGFFTFSKLLMYLDLDPDRWPNDSNIINHPLVGNLLLGREDPSSGLGSSEDNIDETHTDKLALVVDADSSQTEAIINAVKGRDMIIEGPPGTGKSQTITNLIACFVHEGKRVLFVAEKMAALNVVHRNLTRVGLADFCLQLHSHKANKKSILEDLKQRAKKRFPRPKNHQDHAKQLKYLRDVLSQYVDLIQSRWGPNKDTLFDIIWKIEEIQSRIEFTLPFRVENIEALTITDVQERILLLEQIASFIKQLGRPIEHPLFGYLPIKLYYNDQESIKQQCSCVTENVRRVIDSINRFNQQTNMGIPSKELTFKELEALAKINHNPLPEDFLADLYDSFYANPNPEKWDLYQKLIDVIRAYRKQVSSASKILDLHRNNNLDLLRESTKCLKQIQRNNLGSLQVKDANDISVVVTHLIDLINKIGPLTQQQIADGMICPKTLNDFLKFLAIDALLREKPPGVPEQILVQSFSPRHRRLLEELLTTGKQLKTEQQKLSEQFDLSLVPTAERLTESRKIMRQNQGKFFAFLSSDYCKTKKYLLGFLRDPKLIKKPGLIDGIEALEHYLNAVETYSKQDTYKKLLADLFQGVDSDWAKLDAILQWSNQLLSQVNSSVTASQLASISEEQLSEWPKHHEIESLHDDILGELESFSEILKETPYIDQIASISTNQLESLTKSLRNFQVLFGHVQQRLCPMVISSETPLNDVSSALGEYIQCLESKQALESHSDYPILFGPHFKGIETSPDELASTLQWFSEFSAQFLPQSIADVLNQSNIKTILSQLSAFTDQLRPEATNLMKAVGFLNDYGSIEEMPFWGCAFMDLTLESYCEKITSITERSDHLVQWADYSRLIKKADDMGLAKLTDIMQTQELEPSKAVDVYSLSLYSELARRAFQDNEYLLTFTRAQHENIRDKYQQLDKDFLMLTQTKIAYQLNKAHVPMGVGRGPVREWTEYALLEREFNKSRRHLPIRRLLERAGEAINALKPVFMMSPMSVAQFLEPGQHEFDVVIMDEASQIQPHEALGAIARAKQMIIVGDPKQLPPTTFFDTTQDNVDDEKMEETLMDDTESILDIASTAHFSTKRLKWHYRSEHESLIAFSNAQWYDNELIVFPSPMSSEIKMGVTFHYVDNAIYGGGKNEIEADRVAQRIIEYAQKHPDLSLGVGTLNIRQKTLVEDRLERLIKNDRSADLAIKNLMECKNGTEPLFIKNLENLQGDERDVIIISCTYGPDQNGIVYQRFGPINGVNGPRRLNVLFTRAKKRVEIFSSMLPEQIRSGHNSSPGAIAFRKYLSYAKTGTLEDFGIETGKEPDSEFEVSVIRVLQDLGYEAVPQVGVAGYYIDIGVMHPHRPGEYILGVECDGAMYHSCRVARDRDRLREEVLIKLGWNIYRIWSTEWFKNRKPTIENLSKTLNDLIEKDKHIIREESEVAESVYQPEIKHKPRQSNDDLFRRLLMFKLANIPDHEQDTTDCILSDEMLKHFVESRPTTKSDFIDCFDTQMRTDLNPDHLQYLDDIFDIIEEAEGIND